MNGLLQVKRKQNGYRVYSAADSTAGHHPRAACRELFAGRHPAAARRA
ncbi:MAG: hypothetical protein ACLTMP_15070 [Eggerthella lenta]